MMKVKPINKVLCLLALSLAPVLPAKAQWTNYDTQSTIRGVFGLANAAIQSAERKKEMEILARQKVEFEQSFQDAMTEAKAAEAAADWEEALEKYEEASKLNCKYSYTDQRTLSQKMSGLYAKAGREDDGPSILNNQKTILADYSSYRYMKENPVCVNKKNASGLRIARVACSDTETRIEMEMEAYSANLALSIKGATYNKSNKGGNLSLTGVENITTAPAVTYIPWPYQKLRFALIFPPLPPEAVEFDFTEPSTTWQFRDIKCK